MTTTQTTTTSTQKKGTTAMSTTGQIITTTTNEETRTMTAPTKTTVAIHEVTDFSVTVEKGAGGYDVHARLNGESRMIGFAMNAKGGGYIFQSLSLSQFPKMLEGQAAWLNWFSSDARLEGGLTLTEVRKRAAILGGIWLAGKTLNMS